jgi:predicted nucleic acid-binding protein
MVLVDTTVWIDFFAAKSTPKVAELERLLNEEEDICTCGIILTEVLQGIRQDEDYRRTLSRFETFLFLPMDRESGGAVSFSPAQGRYHTKTSRLHDCLCCHGT